MRAVTCGLLLLGAGVLQSTLMTRVDLFGGRPDLVLLVVIAWAMQRGPSEGIVAGIAGGFVLDSLSGTPFGVHTVLLGIIGFCSSLGESALYRGSLPLFLGAAALASVAYHVALALALQMLGWQPPGLARFTQVAAPSALLNALLMPGAFWLVRRSMRWFRGWRRLEV